MKKTRTKGLGIALLVAILAFVFVGCGNGEAKKEKEYLDQMETLATSFEKEANTMQTEMGKFDGKDKTAAQAVIDSIKGVKEPLGKLKDLKAPEKYKEAQAKISSGSDKMIQGLDLCADICQMVIDDNVDQSTFMDKYNQMIQLITDGSNEIQEGATLGDKASKK